MKLNLWRNKNITMTGQGVAIAYVILVYQNILGTKRDSNRMMFDVPKFNEFENCITIKALEYDMQR